MKRSELILQISIILDDLLGNTRDPSYLAMQVVSFLEDSNIIPEEMDP